MAHAAQGYAGFGSFMVERSVEDMVADATYAPPPPPFEQGERDSHLSEGTSAHAGAPMGARLLRAAQVARTSLVVDAPLAST